MNYTQVTDPLEHLGLSALIAAVPILFIFWALIIRRMKGYQASLLTMLIALFVAVLMYSMPIKLAVLSTLHGALYGLFPICWIIIGAVFLYNITVAVASLRLSKTLWRPLHPIGDYRPC